MGFHAYAARRARGRLAPFVYEPAELGLARRRDRASATAGSATATSTSSTATGAPRLPDGARPRDRRHGRGGGASVRHLGAGQRVGVGWQCGACLECESCVRGQENLCARRGATCVAHPAASPSGSASTRRFAFPIPEALRSEHAAPLLCGGITVYAPLARYARPSLRVGVVGIGGLGHLALQFARAMGCEVTALSRAPTSEAEAHGFGAHRFVARARARGRCARSRSSSTSCSRPCSWPPTRSRCSNAAPERRALLRGRAGRAAAARRRLDARPAAERHDERDRRAPGRSARRSTSPRATGSSRRSSCGRSRRRTPPRGREEGPARYRIVLAATAPAFRPRESG